MNRPLSTIPLPASVLSTLREHGFHYYEDVVDRKGIVGEAKNILHHWHLADLKSWLELTTPPTTVTALDISQDESANPGIVTWSKKLDDLLGGGIPIGSITELCGPPGCGKTQISLQLCVDVQIPKLLGGLEGEAVFIDTACGYHPERLRSMAEACCLHCDLLIAKHHFSKGQPQFDVNKILSSVHVASPHGISQLLAAVKLLPDFINQHQQVKLVVIDSLAFPFICGDSCSTINRTGYLYRILGDLQKLAQDKKLAIVVTNQITTHLSGKSADRKSELAPALGESFGHRVNQRVVLGRISKDFHAAMVVKGVCSDKSAADVYFRVSSYGFIDEILDKGFSERHI